MELALTDKDPKTSQKRTPARPPVQLPMKNIVVLEVVPKKENVENSSEEAGQETVSQDEGPGSQRKLLYACGLCNVLCDSSSALKEHRKNSHRYTLIEKTPNTSQRSTPSGAPVKLPLKNVVVLEVVSTKENVENITDEKHCVEPGSERKVLYGCEMCSSYFDLTSALKEHRKNVHNLDAPYSKDLTRFLSARQPKCNICQSFYMTRTELINHQKRAHDLNASISDTKRKAEHKCNICEAVFTHKANLMKHLGDAHCIDMKKPEKEKTRDLDCGVSKAGPSKQTALDNADSVDIVLLEQDGKRMFQCGICKMIYTTRQSVHRHNRNNHNIKGPRHGICHHCGNTYRIDHLSTHEKSCVNRAHARRRQDCSYKDCKASFYKKEHLIDHMKSAHSMRIEPMRTLRFKSEEEFKAWKEEEEARTYSYFSKHAGTKNNKRQYYCQREGTAKSHRSSTDKREIKKQNKKGRIKTGCVCTSYLRSVTTDTEVVVYYWPTHNHPLTMDDVKHQPLSKATIQFIKEQVALNVPSRQIQVMLKKRLSENPSYRRDAQVVSLKRITSLAQRYHLLAAKAGTVPNAVVESFNSFMEVLVAQDDSPVLFYQPPSENTNLEFPNQEDHLFFLGLQTIDQQKMLQRDISMPMFISYTKADYTYQYYLISILVPCENNFEYPVGHLMTSQLNEEVISLFLQTVGERCPELNVNCIVSIDCPEINSAIRKVFGNDGPYFLSKWHFLEFMRNEFLKPVPANKVEELFDFILAMADAETEDRFLLLYNTFKEQFESEFPDIISDFAEYFVRASVWASCYRQGPGIIDSCLYADSFFSKLNKKYRRRPTKSINVVPDLLLFMQEEYREKRENQQGDNDEEMKEQHLAASEISPELVQEMLLHHWTVQGSKHGQAFSVMHCASKCFDPDCQLKCSDCTNLCSHRYFCNCGKSESICQHVHKVHQQYGLLLETEDDCHSAEDMLMDQDEDTGGGDDSISKNEEQMMPEPDIDTLKADIMSYIDKLKTSLENMPPDMLRACHKTLQSLCSLLDSNSANNDE